VVCDFLDVCISVLTAPTVCMNSLKGYISKEFVVHCWWFCETLKFGMKQVYKS